MARFKFFGPSNRRVPHTKRTRRRKRSYPPLKRVLKGLTRRR